VSLSHKRKRFVIEGVTYFNLQVVFGEHGEPLKLVGHYEAAAPTGRLIAAFVGSIEATAWLRASV